MKRPLEPIEWEDLRAPKPFCSIEEIKPIALPGTEHF
jgi:hypothetical protein